MLKTLSLGCDGLFDLVLNAVAAVSVPAGNGATDYRFEKAFVNSDGVLGAVLVRRLNTLRTRVEVREST